MAAAILAQLLERCGIGTRVASFEAIAARTYVSLDLEGVQVVCLSYMNPASIAHARYAVRRLRRRARVPIVVGFWTVDATEPNSPDLLAATRSDISVTSLGEAVEEIMTLVPAAVPASPSAVAE